MELLLFLLLPEQPFQPQQIIEWKLDLIHGVKNQIWVSNVIENYPVQRIPLNWRGLNPLRWKIVNQNSHPWQNSDTADAK